ncbi:MAG: hypothetical protein ACRDGN_04570 [bacterium]
MRTIGIEGHVNMRLLEWTCYGNPVGAWLGALAMAVVVFVGLRVLMGLAIRRLARRAEATRTEMDDHAVDLLRRTRFPFVLALAVYVGSFALDLPPGPSRALDIAVVIAILVQIALWVNRLIAFAIARYMDIQQAINLEIFRRFKDAGIEFAYPTQTLYLGRSAAPVARSAGDASQAHHTASVSDRQFAGRTS